MIKRLTDKAISVAMVVVALLVLLKGNLWAALVIFGLALWMLGRATRVRETRGASSTLRSATIAMTYDPRTGTMDGMVTAGPLAGWPLARLDRAACADLHRRALRDDPEGARLLEAYFDRRFPGWGGTGHGDADARTHGVAAAGWMSEDEAYQILGLRRGAAREDIVRSHRTLMKKWHPDQGGSADLAARANEAKEVLLRRHA